MMIAGSKGRVEKKERNGQAPVRAHAVLVAHTARTFVSRRSHIRQNANSSATVNDFESEFAAHNHIALGRSSAANGFVGISR